MGNSRSRNRNSGRTTFSRVLSNQSESQDIHRLAELLILRNELEQRQEALRRSAIRTELRLNEEFGEEPSIESQSGRMEETLPRSILRGFIRHHLLMEYLERNPNMNDEEDEEEDENNNDEDRHSFTSVSTYEGLQELFESQEICRDDETIVIEKARKIQLFQGKMTDILERDKIVLEKKINAALDVHMTLQDLIRNKESADSDDQLSFIQNLIADIKQSEEFVDHTEIGILNKDLDDIGGHVQILKELTTVSEEDEVNCTVCLSCPVGVIWDCIKCDHLVCDTCKRRITSCPTCRVRFRSKAPRRNRWAEKLARLQREKTQFSS